MTVPTLPNFLICGAAQSGTTFLASALAQHRDIFLPKRLVPEPNYFYFSDRYARPIEEYSKRWFQDVTTETAIGEKSSSYIFGPEVAHRIRSDLPGVRLIFLLRNPIERAFANYRFSVLQGVETRDFEEAIRNENADIFGKTNQLHEVRPHSYVARSLYFQQLQRFRREFDAQQILVLKAEAMFQDPQETFNRCFAFLAVPRAGNPMLPPTFKTTDVLDRNVQSEARRYFGEQFGEIVESIRRGEDLVEQWGHRHSRDALERIKGNLSNRKLELPPNLRCQLREMFRTDLDQLEAFVEFSIDDWS